jgi:hypothetical protein
MSDCGRSDELLRAIEVVSAVGIYPPPFAPGSLSADEALAWHEQTAERLCLLGDWRQSRDGSLVPVAVVVADAASPRAALPELRRPVEESALRRAAALSVALVVLAGSLLSVVVLLALVVRAGRFAVS